MTSSNFHRTQIRSTINLRILAAAICVTSAIGLLTCSTTAAQTTAQNKSPLVELNTSAGKITIALDAEKAPKTVANFLSYVKSGHYNGTIFHRVIPDFMIQGGGLDAAMKEKKTKPPIVNEGGNGLKNVKYSIAMARTNDPNSATSQFFINTKDNGFLNQSGRNAGYAVFGRVVKGLGVVDTVSNVKTTTKESGDRPGLPMQNVPVTAVTIESAKIVQQ
ncbi:MAG: peptidyl-prolyl cis-trans isomerase [Rubripirellula sp.]|nr:peptidylprolyl isomerase [Rhodopirellula sp.]MCH1439815.1 peptidyl-prolyl cis-trans isomerase [Rubripirellula sp.]